MLRRAMLAAVAALLYALSMPAAVAGGDALPDEPPAIELAGMASQVLVADLDSDGSREIVRLLVAGSQGALVDAMRSTGKAWTSVGEAPLPGSSFRLLVWRDDGRERVAIVGATPASDDPAAADACCTDITAVEMDGDRVVTRPLGGGFASAHAALALDLDGDATDELILAGPGRVTAMRWTRDHFEEFDSIAITRGDGQTPVAMGDSDGEPGEEALLVESGPTGTSAGGFLVRIALGPDGLRVDSTRFPSGSTSDTGVAAIGGSRVVIVGSNRSLVAEWPAGGGLRPEGTVDVGGRLVGVLRSSDSAAILIANDRVQALEVLDEDLRRIRTIDPTPEARAVSDAGLIPFAGELPGGLPGNGQAYLYGGTLLSWPAGADDVVESPWASFAGVRPVGLVGPGHADVAILDQVAESTAATRHGGRLADADEGVQRSPTVASAASLFVAPTAPVHFQPFESASSETAADGGTTLLAGPEGFTVAFDAPATSVVLLTVDAGDLLSERRFVVPDSGHLDAAVPASALLSDGTPAEAQLLVRTPSGRAYVSPVTLRIDVTPPEISTTTPFLSLGPTVRVRGDTEADARVVADGEDVPVAADGSFEVEVSAGLLPRDVRIEATDPLGNRFVVVPSVVAFLDYRMVPWPVVLLLLLVAVGARLYWRPPRADRADRSRGRSRPAVEGLEEIDR